MKKLSALCWRRSRSTRRGRRADGGEENGGKGGFEEGEGGEGGLVQIVISILLARGLSPDIIYPSICRISNVKTI